MSRSRRTARPVLTASGPGDLVAAVPYLVGFTPTASLVVTSLRGARLRLGLVARLDLPAGRSAEVATDRPTRQTAVAMTDFVLRDHPREVVALVYDAAPWSPADPPWRGLVQALDTELADRGVGVRDAVYVGAERYWSFTCSDTTCCPVDGTALSSAASSPVAAAFVLEGRAPLADRASLRARVSAQHPLTAAAVDAVATGELERIAPARTDPGQLAWFAWQVATVRLVDDLARRYVAGGPEVRADEAGRVLAGLVDTTSRDAVAVRWTRWLQAMPGAAGSGGDDVADPVEQELRRVLAAARPADTRPVEPDLADPAVHDAVERLFVDLATRCDGPLALAPLVLTAMHAWAAGEGAQAGVAVDRALAIDPRYRMAGLVDAVLRSGLVPAWVAAARVKDEALPPRNRAERRSARRDDRRPAS